MALFGLFKKKKKASSGSEKRSGGATAPASASASAKGSRNQTPQPVQPRNVDRNTAASDIHGVSADNVPIATPVEFPQPEVPSAAPREVSTSSSTLSAVVKRKSSSFSILRKSSFAESAKIHLNNNTIGSQKDLPAELLPIVTLVSHQQSRNYFKGPSYYKDSSNSDEWLSVFLQLIGNEIVIARDEQSNADLVVNICDCELNLNKPENTLTVLITNESIMYFRFEYLHQLVSFFTSILLCKFEYQQLQQAYTGALLSSQAINFSDIKTLLASGNKHAKEEWCVIRFPFLNDKWVRCLVVVKPGSEKMELYINHNKNAKNLLAIIKDCSTSYTIYPNEPSQIQDNSLIRLYGNSYINLDLLNNILNDENFSSLDTSIINNPRSRSRSRSNSKVSKTSSLNKRLSISSLNTTTSSNPSINGDIKSTIGNKKVSKKLKKKNIITSKLVYIIPESHASVLPSEVMLRLLIPIFNTYKLYGRPNKFLSSRNDKSSLLFGLPQLPNLKYLTNELALELVTKNLDNSLTEEWNIEDWMLILKEFLSMLIDKGWQLDDRSCRAVASDVDVGVVKKKEQGYDPMEDFEGPV